MKKNNRFNFFSQSILVYHVTDQNSWVDMTKLFWSVNGMSVITQRGRAGPQLLECTRGAASRKLNCGLRSVARFALLFNLH